MPFQKGQSGNPGGRRSDKPWRAALDVATRRTLAETEELLADPKAPMIARAAAQLVANAAAGDVPAIKELGDRIDGRARQEIEVIEEDIGLEDLSDEELTAYLHTIRQALVARDQDRGGKGKARATQRVAEIPPVSETG